MRAHGVGSVETEGRVIHRAGFYDVIIRIVSLGREARLRRRMIDAAGLHPGQRVLDVGCGTGTVAVAAAKIVGEAGRVYGVDPAAEMIDRARKKAEQAGVEVELEVGAVESLPYPGDSMDTVITTLVFHHLTPRLQSLAMVEIRRVLVPGGRLVLIDLGGRRQASRLAGEAEAAGLTEIASRRFGPRLLFVLTARSG